MGNSWLGNATSENDLNSLTSWTWLSSVNIAGRKANAISGCLRSNIVSKKYLLSLYSALVDFSEVVCMILGITFLKGYWQVTMDSEDNIMW